MALIRLILVVKTANKTTKIAKFKLRDKKNIVDCMDADSVHFKNSVSVNLADPEFLKNIYKLKNPSAITSNKMFERVNPFISKYSVQLAGIS